MNPRTNDSLFNGRLRISQSRNGYRFSIDAVLLAAQAGLYDAERILDLGTGCGVIPLVMAYRNPRATYFGIEIQKSLADIALMNVRANGMDDCITIVCDDLCAVKCSRFSGPVDMVVSNPPYRKVASGRVNPCSERAIARHEIKATLGDVVRSASRMLPISGRFVTIYPACRITDLLSTMRSFGVEPKQMQLIHSTTGSEAKLVLVDGLKGGGPGLIVRPPLVIYSDDGGYTDAVQQMFYP